MKLLHRVVHVCGMHSSMLMELLLYVLVVLV